MADAQLQELAQKLGTPGGQKLYQAARKRGIQVTKDQVRQYVRRQGQKQIFRPRPAAAGKTASESEQMRAQMDLIDQIQRLPGLQDDPCVSQRVESREIRDPHR